MDLAIPAVLDADLVKYDFISTVPVEIVQEKVYDLNPEYLWTGVEGGEAQGGILWKIEPEIILRVNSALSADYSIYGDISGYGDVWNADIQLFRKDRINAEHSFSASGTRRDERPEKLKKLADDIAAWLKKEYTLTEAEETVRRYLGNIIVRERAIQGISAFVREYPDSVPLRALLLDLYLRDRENYENEILKEAAGIMRVYRAEDESDTRYLLSLSMDPYDAAARVMEKHSDWVRAIQVREEALKAFPFRADMHRENLGKDYLQKAGALEGKGDISGALESYKNALMYLDPSSEHAHKATGSIQRIKK